MNKKLLFSIILLSTVDLFAQEAKSKIIDSLKKLTITEDLIVKNNSYYEISNEYSGINLDSTIYYGEKALEYFESKNEYFQKTASLYYILGISYLDLNLDQANYYIRKSLSKAESGKNDSLKAINYLAISSYYSRNPNIDSSNFYIIKATKYFTEKKDSVALAFCYFNLMSNYNDLEKIDNCIEYGEKALLFAERKNIENLLNHIPIALAFTYLKSNKKIELAKKYILKAKVIAKETNNIHLLSEIYFTIASKKYRDK